MASILSAIGWLLRCDDHPERNEDTLGGTFSNDRHSRGVQLAETGQHQLMGFFASIRILLHAIFAPASVPLIPALPQIRKRYVKHSAMEKLSKSDKAQHKDEECYICLRPVGTRHLVLLTEAAAAAAAAAASSSATTNKSTGAAAASAAVAFSPLSKLDVEEQDDDGDENESSSGSGSDDDEDSDCGEKSPSFSEKQLQQHEHPERRRQPQQQQPQLQQQQDQQQQQEQQRRRQRRKSSSPPPPPPSPPRVILALPCGHRFCDCCVRRWLSSHASCPTCRYQFPERDCEVVKEP